MKHQQTDIVPKCMELDATHTDVNFLEVEVKGAIVPRLRDEFSDIW